MKINFLKYIAIAIAAIGMAACSSSDIDVPPATTRTVLVYMVANNNLSTFADDDLSEMEIAAKEGQLGNSRWIIYLHSKTQEPKLMELTETGFNDIKYYDSSVSSITISRMKQVITDAKSAAPALDYGLILWSHANGWVADGITDYSRSFGDDNGKKMNISNLRIALANQGFSFIYTDCCNMSAVEVAYELRNVAETFAGSTLELPSPGMPYHLTMKYFTSSTASLPGAAKETFDYYSRLYQSDNSYWCAMSVIKLSAMDKLAEETRKLYQTSTFPAGYTPQRLDRSSENRYFDFKHFADALSGDKTSWNAALADAVIYEACMKKFFSLTINSHCGLSTFILGNQSSGSSLGYQQTEWYSDVARYQPLP